MDIEERIRAFIEAVFEHLHGHQHLDDTAKKTKLQELESEFYSIVTPYTSPQEAMLRFLEKKQLA